MTSSSDTITSKGVFLSNPPRKMKKSLLMSPEAEQYHIGRFYKHLYRGMVVASVILAGFVAVLASIFCGKNPLAFLGAPEIQKANPYILIAAFVFVLAFALTLTYGLVSYFRYKLTKGAKPESMFNGDKEYNKTKKCLNRLEGGLTRVNKLVTELQQAIDRSFEDEGKPHERVALKNFLTSVTSLCERVHSYYLEESDPKENSCSKNVCRSFQDKVTDLNRIRKACKRKHQDGLEAAEVVKVREKELVEIKARHNRLCGLVSVARTMETFYVDINTASLDIRYGILPPKVLAGLQISFLKTQGIVNDAMQPVSMHSVRRLSDAMFLTSCLFAASFMTVAILGGVNILADFAVGTPLFYAFNLMLAASVVSAIASFAVCIITRWERHVLEKTEIYGLKDLPQLPQPKLKEQTEGEGVGCFTAMRKTFCGSKGSYDVTIEERVPEPENCAEKKPGGLSFASLISCFSCSASHSCD